MQALGRVTALDKFGGNLIDTDFGASENDTVEVGLDVDDAGQCIEFVTLAYLEIYLIGKFGCQGLRLHFEQLWRLHKAFGKGANTVGHSGREEQNAVWRSHLTHYLLNILDEAHI